MLRYPGILAGVRDRAKKTVYRTMDSFVAGTGVWLKCKQKRKYARFMAEYVDLVLSANVADLNCTHSFLSSCHSCWL